MTSTDRPLPVGTDVVAAEATVRRRQVAVFAAASLGGFMSSLDMSMVNVAFPALERSFPSVTPSGLSWVVTAYAIVFGALMVTGGRLADHLGRRSAFMAGIAVFCAGSAICSAAPTWEAVIAGRVVQAVGAALLVPGSLGVVLESFRGPARSHAVAAWSGVGGLAVAAGPSLGALLIQAAGWRAAFYINLPVGLAAWALALRVLPANQTTAPSRPGVDPVGVALATGALAALVFAISEGPVRGWGDVLVVTVMAAAAAAVAGFVRHCLRHPDPVLDLGLFGFRTFAVANAAMVFYAMAFFAILLSNVLFLAARWNYSIVAGLAITPAPLVVAAISSPASHWARRIGFRAVLVTGFAVLAGGFVYYAVAVGDQPRYLSEWLPATIITGLGIGLTYPVLGAAAVADLRAERFALGSAVIQTARQIGGAIGIAILAAILGSANPSPRANPPHRAYLDLWLFDAASACAALTVCATLHHRYPVPKHTPPKEQP